MTDAMTNAERLLREKCERARLMGQRCNPEPPFLLCEYCAAADALAAERERRGRLGLTLRQWVEQHDGISPADRDRLIAELDGYGLASLVIAAPPLPPATGEGTIRAAVIEECANVCDSFADERKRDGADYAVARRCAKKIRALSTPPAKGEAFDPVTRTWIEQAPSRPTPEPSVPGAVGETRKDLDARTWCAECRDEIVPNDGAICEMCAIALRAALAAQEGTT